MTQMRGLNKIVRQWHFSPGKQNSTMQEKYLKLESNEIFKIFLTRIHNEIIKKKKRKEKKTKKKNGAYKGL